MNAKTHSTLAAVAAAAIFATMAHAQQSGDVPATPRPADPTANLPSGTGAQTTLPSGAVTGAGQPQGTVKQPRAGAPGGLEQRARREARTGGTGATGGGQTGGTAAGTDAPAASTGAADGREGEAGTRTRAARQSRG